MGVLLSDSWSNPIAMSRRTPAIPGNSTLRELVLSVVGLALLLWLTDFSLDAAIPLAVLFGSIALHDLLDERYALPDGTRWIAYGASVAAVGTYIAVRGAVGPGVVAAVVGGWFVLDGAATVRAGASSEPHEYAAALDETNNGEAMLRIQTLGSIHEALREHDDPRTVSEIADTLGLATERAASALDYLETRGQVERVDGKRYRAVEPRWGSLQPVVSFVQWLPRRLLRPIRLL